MNLVEMIADEKSPSPCLHGNIVDGHACYCHSDAADAPRKCPIWSRYGEHDISKWRRGAWNDGACPHFTPTTQRDA